jgi:hypothetical protein
MEMLLKYKQFGSFNFYAAASKIGCFKECNAPSDASGIYLIYGVTGCNEELVYIGRSGELLSDGTMKHRVAGLGGIRDRLVNGKYKYTNTGLRVTRYIFWKEKMVEEKFEKLKIKWFVTHSGDYLDCPIKLEDNLIRIYKPKWNRL